MASLPGSQQWHVSKDGAVIASWPDEKDPERTRYGRYTTTRAVSAAELAGMNRRLERFGRFWDRLTTVLLVTFIVALVLVVGGLALGWTGLAPAAALPISIVGAVFFVITSVVAVFLAPGLMHQRFERIFLDTGLESSSPKVIDEAQARELMADGE